MHTLAQILLAFQAFSLLRLQTRKLLVFKQVQEGLVLRFLLEVYPRHFQKGQPFEMGEQEGWVFNLVLEAHLHPHQIILYLQEPQEEEVGQGLFILPRAHLHHH